jgi:glutathione S-transferase
LRLEALADGMVDAGILTRYETILRPEEKRWTSWVDGQLGKLRAGLDQAEREAAGLEGPITLGQIALGCALGWMEFRKVGGDIRSGHPKLLQWYDRFAKRPSMQETQPKG